MVIKLERYDANSERTIGRLLIDGEVFCYTLEDPVREVKIPGSTCIPLGVYKILMTWSNRFRKVLPLLVDVPGFTGIRIHSGNSAFDTEGCILVGLNREADTITQSKLALGEFIDKLKLPATIEIKNA